MPTDESKLNEKSGTKQTRECVLNLSGVFDAFATLYQCRDNGTRCEGANDMCPVRDCHCEMDHFASEQIMAQKHEIESRQ